MTLYQEEVLEQTTDQLKPLAIVDAFMLLEQLASRQNTDITDVVREAHDMFATAEPYEDLALHANDAWHSFLVFGIKVYECTESSGDRNKDVNALLGKFVTHYSFKINHQLN